MISNDANNNNGTSGIIDLSKGSNNRKNDCYEANVLDLSKGANNHKNGNYNGFQQFNSPSNIECYGKLKGPISIDSTSSDNTYFSFSSSSKESDLVFENKKGRKSFQKTFSPLSPISAEKENIFNSESEEPKEKIPRPPNAFMIFAIEWRKHLAKRYPLDSNKTISVRLGQHWKILDENQKRIYYRKAKLQDSEHKKKYPDYQYNPKEARIRKAQRDALKVAQRQAASAVPLLQSPGYSPLSNTSRLDMNSTSPMQQFIPAYTSQQTLGQNVGSISGGGIINTGPSPLGSRSPAIVLSNTTSRRPPPPAYPGLARQQSFHHGLEPNHREYGMGYGEPNFNPLPNIYSNNQNISSPSESHTSGMFDSHYQNSTPMESGLWNGMSQSTNMWNSQNFDLQRQHSLNDYSPFQSPAEQHSRNQLIPATSTPTPGTNLDDPNMFNHSDFPADFPSKITAETQKKVLDLVVANDYLNIPKWNANSIVNFGVPPNYGLFTHGLVPPILYDLNCMNLYEADPNNNNKNKSPKLQACFGPQHEIFTTSDVAVKYYSGMFQHMNSTINATPQVPLMGVSNINTVLQNKEQTDPKMVSTTVVSSTDDIIDIAADDDYVISTTTC